MYPKMIWANFSVKDTKRTTEFYSQLGFSANGTNMNPQLASFSFGKDKFVIHFFQEDSQIKNYLPPWSQKQNEIMFTLAAETKQQVDEWYEKVKLAAGKIIFEPTRDLSGYYGFAFEDPDGHKFNILLMDNM